MIQGRECPRFALEAGEPLRVLRQLFGQDLDRDIASQIRVGGATPGRPSQWSWPGKTARPPGSRLAWEAERAEII